MCGFLGIVSKDKINQDKLISCNRFQTCRGPDEFKTSSGKIMEKFNFSFIFNRLAIQDLSKAGSQPMYSDKFNSLILFNGEIFNHDELRQFLKGKGISFNSKSSDTEVLLNGLSMYGKSFIKKLTGQFSIFFVDYKKNNLLLARDRLGQKPLFYKKTNDSLIFSSNLKSIISYEDSYEIDEKSLSDYIEYDVVPSPNTLFKNLYKLRPAEIISFNFNGDNIVSDSEIYWNPEEFISENKFDPDLFKEKLIKAITLRSSADVPVASFLSGGLDSTSIVKLMSENLSSVDTFSVGFSSKKYDESEWSSKVALKYDTKHYLSTFNNESIHNEIYKSIDSLDEPYSDPSIVPTYIISKKISEKYKVALSGDGGDELLGGYDRTQLTINNNLNLLKAPEISYQMYPAFLGTGNTFLSKSNNRTTAYKSFLSDHKFKKLILKDSIGNFDISSTVNSDYMPYKSLLLSDYKFFLPEMMLLKIDRLSMANSLEVRSPFVDHKLVEYILSTNLYDYNNGLQKRFLKDLLSRDFGPEFINRKKMGFVFDIENWVYNNLNLIGKSFSSGNLVLNLNKNILNILSLRKSRINAIRIWKLLIIERYLQELKT
tara:strand:- start:1442 stop:3238 length:1797 start_codon:yes stop_codon:yes gene_type:complete